MEGEQVNQSIHVGNYVWSISFSPNGDKLACGIDYDIYVYDVETGALILGPLKGHNYNITCAVVTRQTLLCIQ
ncbi:hypothetical protein JVT61DRAFT_8517 [Boletus reticuloceps]|uniref:Uncharacterized protein n=1 Tax=Boletus reticuloceps TaxID=495285 RepID=A0A8I2YYP5_9AGAM|nr:hypothetical protein JVT61DRAFT_8517 [Boletus reticuloceps]